MVRLWVFKELGHTSLVGVGGGRGVTNRPINNKKLSGKSNCLEINCRGISN